MTGCRIQESSVLLVSLTEWPGAAYKTPAQSSQPLLSRAKGPHTRNGLAAYMRHPE
jgi:hypothetical protein